MNPIMSAGYWDDLGCLGESDNDQYHDGSLGMTESLMADSDMFSWISSLFYR
jgi:hypothetical protein